MDDPPAHKDSTKYSCAVSSTEAAGSEAVVAPAGDAQALCPTSSYRSSPVGHTPSPFGGRVSSAERPQELQGFQSHGGPRGEAERRQEQQAPKGPCVEKLSMCAPFGSNGLERRDEDCVADGDGGGCVRTPEDFPCAAETDIETACRETFVFANAKAGMDMTEEEKAKIAAKIFELSKNSPFFLNEMRKKKQMEEQLAVLRRRVQLFTSCGGCAEASAAARRVLQLLQQQQQRESGHVYVHLDMDMFFCAVEMRDDPSLRSQPMAVGSLSMLSTANYAARRFGVRSGMPGFIAKQLCPSLAIVRPNFRKYRATGETIRYVLQAYDPSLSLHSLDEASLDVTDCLNKRFPRTDAEALSVPPTSTPGNTEEMPAEAAAAATTVTDRVAALVSEIRAAVTAATGLSCSAGAASSRMVAKIASDMNKPNGQKIVEATGASAEAAGAATAAFLQPLNVRKVPGIGKHREKMLSAFDIRTCGELLQQAPLLLHLLPRITAVHLIRMALGVDGLPPELQQQHQQQHHQQSISSEETFSATNELPVLRRVVEQLAAAVAKQLKELRQEGDHVTLKVKFADFSLRTISHRLAQHTDDAAAIATAAQGLLQSVMREQLLKKQTNSNNSSGSSNSKSSLRGMPTWVRLLGVRLSGFRQAKAGSIGLRRLDEFFSQQPQSQQPKLAAATGADAGLNRIKEDWRVGFEELDDLLAVLSQHQHETATAQTAVPAEQEPAAYPAHAGFAAAATSPAKKFPAKAATAAAVVSPTWRAKDAPEEETTVAPDTTGTIAGETAPLGVVAAKEATTPSGDGLVKTAPAQGAAQQQQESKSVRANSSSSSTQRQEIKELQLNVTPLHPQQQRRRLPSPPIHEQLMKQKRQKGRQQPHLLELLRRPSKRRKHNRIGLEQSQKRSQGQLERDTVVVEVVSD